MKRETSLRLVRRTLLLAAVLPLAWSATAWAATVVIEVGSSSELVDAFAAADADPGNHYHLRLARGTYKPSQTLTLTRGFVTLEGSPSGNPAKFVVDGQRRRRVFLVNGAGSCCPYLEVIGVTIQNGVVGATEPGGGLWVHSAGAALTDSVVRDNQANQPGAGLRASGDSWIGLYSVLVRGTRNDQALCGGGRTAAGGGLAVTGAARATIVDSTFTENTACRGGAIVFQASGSSWIENSTISGNEAIARGGGIFLDGGTGIHYWRFNTIAFNEAGTVLGRSETHYGGGLGLAGFTGTLRMFGNILARNSVIHDHKVALSYRGDDCFRDGEAFDSVAAGNVVGQLDNCLHLGSPGRGIGVEGARFDPGLGLLTPNGSAGGLRLPTHKPFEGSPVIGNYLADNEDHDVCPPKDQRGFIRPYAPAAVCDNGAIEYAGKRR